MQSHYPECFDREMGCTPEEWRMWLPAAMGDAVWQIDHDVLHAKFSQATQATLRIGWHVGPVRRIALMAMPVLKVRFEFAGLDATQRYTFMKRFDLYMQRGGG